MLDVSCRVFNPLLSVQPVFRVLPQPFWPCSVPLYSCYRRGMPGRFAGLLLMLPMLLPAGESLDETQTQIDFLDVGQGLSVLLTTRGLPDGL